MNNPKEIINPDFILFFTNRFRKNHKTITDGIIIKNGKTMSSKIISPKFADVIRSIGRAAKRIGWITVDFVKENCI
jgi:hypothetical protein